MSRREEKTEKVAESASIAWALADLIEKNRAQAVELEALGRLVDAEIAAAQEREAEQAARLGEALDELAEAVAAREIEVEKRTAAEKAVVELVAWIDQIGDVAARARAAVQLKVAGVAETTPVEAEAASAPVAVAGSAGLGQDGGDAANVGATPDAMPITEPTVMPAEAAIDRHPKPSATMRIVIELEESDALLLKERAAREGVGDSDALARSLLLEALHASASVTGGGALATRSRST
jgi:hypothetical protein